MKKIALTSTFALLCLVLMSFVTKPKTNDSKIDSNWKARTTEVLSNSQYNMTLTLYSNGYASLSSSAGPAAGRYDIDRDNWITINWEDGDPETGFVQTIQTNSGTRIKSATIKGVTFNNTERFVVPRH